MKQEVSFLSAREKRMLREIAKAFVPRGGPFEPGAEDLDLIALFNRFAQGFDKPTLWGFKLMLFALWHLPFLILGKPKTFGRLSSEDQIRYLKKLEQTRIYSLRGIFMATKALLGMLVFSDELMEKYIGYERECFPPEGLKVKSEAVKQSQEFNSDLEVGTEVCVIGSGAGGAVVAKELSEAGLDVTVLEQGGYYAQEDFYRKPIDAFPLFYHNNSFTFTLGSPMVSVSMAKGIGGTTVINSCTCFRVPEEVVEDWAENYHLQGLTMKELLPYFQRVEEIINVKPGDMNVIGKNALMTKKGAEALGLSHGPILRNTRNCKGCGLCNYGCPEGAKQSMERTYIPLALKAGARIFADCRAEKIIVENGKASGVQAVVLDRLTKKPKNRLRVKAKVIIVSCGAIFSPVLLLKNKIGNQSGQVGKHLRIHPGARVSGMFDEVIEQWKGIMQSYYVDSYLKEGIMFEATGLAPCVGALTMPFSGLKYKELMANFKNTVNLGLLISDSSEGRVRIGLRGEPLIVYQLNHEDFLKTIKGIKIGARILFAAGAGQVFTGLAPIPVINSVSEIEKINEHQLRKTDLEYMAFHPMGTCRMGDNPKFAVVNQNLECHTLKNLFVADASIFPTSLGVNPQLTIMAFATRLAEFLKQERKRYFS